MSLLFLVSVFGIIAIIPIHFFSVEHLALQKKYGNEKGRKIGEIYGLVSGWGLFLFWVGLWFSPQPRFFIPLFLPRLIQLPIVNLVVSPVHLIVFIPFFVLAVWLGLSGVKEVTLKASEIHRSTQIVTQGVYSLVRHPQYLGGLLAHVGISFFLSAWYSLLSTPLLGVLIYIISKKEEIELIKEFGEEYTAYQKMVPMLIPKWS